MNLSSSNATPYFPKCSVNILIFIGNVITYRFLSLSPISFLFLYKSVRHKAINIKTCDDDDDDDGDNDDNKY